MATRNSYMSWWRPLPLGLKLITVLAAYPAWLFVIYCVLSGKEKSTGAVVGFSVFAVCTVLHMIFDKRNRFRRTDVSGGVELGGGE